MVYNVALAAIAGATLLSTVAAHGEVRFVKANGVSNTAPNQYYDGDSANGNTAVRVQYKSSGQAFVLPSAFSDNSQMACEGAGPAPRTLKIAAGSTLSVYWEGATNELLGRDGTGGTSYNPWVHAMGPVLDYITSCKGSCTSFDATNAGWTKIAHMGIDLNQSPSQGLRNAMNDKPEPYHPTGNGLWASAKLIQQGSKWDIRIPSSLKSGQYIVRHEVGAIHNPKNGDSSSGAQHYIACIQIDVTGGGSATLPSGTKAGSLYSPNGDYANFNVYNDSPSSFKTPGPAIWDGASGSNDDNSDDGGDNNNDDDKDEGSSGGDSGSGSGSGKTTTKEESKPATTTKKEETKTSTAAAVTSTSTRKACKNRKRGLERALNKHKRNMRFSRGFEGSL